MPDFSRTRRLCGATYTLFSKVSLHVLHAAREPLLRTQETLKHEPLMDVLQRLHAYRLPDPFDFTPMAGKFIP